MTINMDSALTDDGMSAQFLWQITVLSLFKNTGIGDVFSLARAWAFSYIVPRLKWWPGLGASQPSHRVAGRPHKHVAEWRPRDHAASQPRGRASSFVRGRPARGPRAALRLQLP